ncbi:MAG TPA: hypothetical protein VJS67_13920 [Pseudonocardiaceae bacterium]|nr:hypothetical protein [Pseudonocardiaceae bacterium]
MSLALTHLRIPVLLAAYPQLRGLSFAVGVLLPAYAARLVRLLTAERPADQQATPMERPRHYQAACALS